MIINKDIGGSVCVVELNYKYPHHRYIDVKQDVRNPEAVFLEYVVNGFVIKKTCCLFKKAPEEILKWVRTTYV